MTDPNRDNQRPARPIKIPLLAESKHLSKFMIAAVVFLVGAAVIVPRVDFSLQEDSPRADATPDPFSVQIEQFEQRLFDGETTEQDHERAFDYAPLIKARALTTAGSMSASDVIAAAETIETYQVQIASQDDLATRLTVRNHRNEVLFEDHPRLNREKADAVLDDVRNAYRQAFELDPGTMATDEASR